MNNFERIGMALFAVLAFAAGCFLAHRATMLQSRTAAKAEWYKASAAYAKCKADFCGDCGPEPVWGNGE